jgi:hypothetical protein
MPLLDFATIESDRGKGEPPNIPVDDPSVGEKDVLFWYARTPKSPLLNPLFLALPRPKINTAFR